MFIFFISFHTFFFIWYFSYASTTSTTILSQHVANVHRINIKTHREQEKQQKLSDIFLQQKKPSTSATNKDEKFILARRLIVWFCRDLLPFCTVDNDGFANFWKSLNIPIPLPTRQNVSINALDDMHNVIKDHLITDLKNSSGNLDLYLLSIFLMFLSCFF